ncbi:MAG: FAD binding domain-containing protein [Spirochaetes bacterium]|nr:FAD binding domain-containing protein [Spirochaetota bacterium]
MVTKFLKPRDAAEALSMLASVKGAVPLAGGTFLLSSQFRDEPMTVVSVAGILPSGVSRTGNTVEIGAGATFQDIIDSPDAPAVLRKACLGMADRNIRNRATAAGNAAAGKSCASLPPVFLTAEASFEFAGGNAPLPAESWLASPSGLITRIKLVFDPERLYGYERWSRTACDVSVLTAAASWRLSGGVVKDLRIACGGLSSHPRRFPELESLFEGKPLPKRSDIEAAVSPFLSPIDDVRGSAAFKRLRASILVADAIMNAEAQP